MTLLRIVIPFQLFCLRVIFSENRYTLFRIMLQAHTNDFADRHFEAMVERTAAKMHQSQSAL
jgi:hypothetical protein